MKKHQIIPNFLFDIYEIYLFHNIADKKHNIQIRTQKKPLQRDQSHHNPSHKRDALNIDRTE